MNKAIREAIENERPMYWELDSTSSVCHTILWATAAVTAIATELMALDEGEYIGDCDEWQ